MREVKHINVLGLLFADDLVLLGENQTEIQELLKIASDFGTEMDLHFNPEKNPTIVSSSHLVGDCMRLTVQGELIPVEHEYKYLGVTICDGRNYLSKREQILRKEAERALHQMQAQLLWSSNKF